MPRSNARSVTRREASRSIRPPKLLQPSPITETRRPDGPRLRSCMESPFVEGAAAGSTSARTQPDQESQASGGRIIGEIESRMCRRTVRVPTLDESYPDASAEYVPTPSPRNELF